MGFLEHLDFPEIPAMLEPPVLGEIREAVEVKTSS